MIRKKEAMNLKEKGQKRKSWKIWREKDKGEIIYNFLKKNKNNCSRNNSNQAN